MDGADVGGVSGRVTVALQERRLEDILQTLHRVDGVLGGKQTSSVYMHCWLHQGLSHKYVVIKAHGECTGGSLFNLCKDKLT